MGAQPVEGRKIRKIHYDFYTDKDGKHFEAFEVGEKNVKVIYEHIPRGPGDVMFYDVEFNDTSMIRVFNISQVFYTKMMKDIVLPDNKLVMPS